MHSGKGPKGYRRSDDRIHEDVCEALMIDPIVDASELEVTVAEGKVTLAGTVDDRATRRRVEDIALAVRGVVDVANNLQSSAR